MNLFANCVLAIDARTGKRIWHFQTVHHDLFDHDNPCPPVMVDVRREGGVVPAVAQVTKTGYCFIFERETGKPVHEIRELPATPSDVEGEQAWPTQPAPVRPPPLARTAFTPADATDISPEANAYVLAKLKGLRHGTAHVPPSIKGSVITPGLHGGATWSGASFDPQTGYLFVNTNNAPYVASLKPDPRDVFKPAAIGYFTDAGGYPAMKPPWGLLTAIDVSKGVFAWQVVLGEFPELTKRGVPPTGTENFGGTIVTAGGLVFIGGTKDERFHAFDKYTGTLLWEHQLPAGGYATPSTYMAGGKQYVVIAAGGGGKPRTKSGDEFVVFALP
jgi:quinoprotein glucose dehydrogenase